MSTVAQPYARWHNHDGPYLRRKRLRLEALLGARCSYCGLSREDGTNLQFHHDKGRDYSVNKLSWSMRLTRYEREIRDGVLLYLACDQSGNDCHNECKREAPSQSQRLYDYPAAGDAANEPF